MKKVLLIKDSIENKITYYHLLLFMVSLPFDSFYSSIVLVSLLLHHLIYFRKEQLQQLNYATLVLLSVFVVTSVSLMYTQFVSRGLDVLSKQLAIVLFPLVLSVTRLNLKIYYQQLMMVFSVGCTLTILYLYCHAMIVIHYYQLPLHALLSAAFVNHNFSLPLHMHATYLSMLVATAIAFLLQQLLTMPGVNRVFYILSISILLLGLIQLGSKSVLIAFILVSNIGIPYFLLKRSQRLKFFRYSFFICALLLVSISSIDIFRQRFITSFEQDLHEKSTVAEQSGRIDRWNLAIDLVKKSPLLGTGSGSEIPLLRELYFERKMYAAYLESLNVHNQYLGMLINNGMLGLLVYVFTIAWGFVMSIRRRDFLLFNFILLVTMVSFSEDLLDVNKGIFFYAFFFSFFIRPGKQIIFSSAGNRLLCKTNYNKEGLLPISQV